jgi:hypothetical protein
MNKKMQFSEALGIVHALAVAGRQTAETNESVTEEKLDEALEIVEDRLLSLKHIKRPKNSTK